LNTAFGEYRTISASALAKSIMKQLETKELVKEQRDAWRMGAALGIAMGKEKDGDKRDTFQNINSLDPEDIFAAIMVGLYPDLLPKERLEKLINHAEWGLREIQRRYELSTLDWTKLGLPDDTGVTKSVNNGEGKSEDEILTQIGHGESFDLELKSSFRWDYLQNRLNDDLVYVILKAIAGFFNSYKGGRLVIGVSDIKQILGLDPDYQRCNPPNKDGFEQLLLRKVRDNIGPLFAAELSVKFYTLYDKEVCVVDIPPGSEPAYVPDKNKESIFYLRIGNSTNQLNVEDAMKHSIKRFYKSSG
jgi:hypothetical protein